MNRPTNPEPPRGEPLARWVRHDLDDARLERQWSAIDGRLELGAPRRSWAVGGRALSLAAAGLACALLAGVAIGRRSARTPASSVAPAVSTATTAPAGFALVAVDGAARTLAMADGVVLRLGEGAAAHVLPSTDDGATIALDAGEVHFDVPPRGGRPFRVIAGAVVVRVVGTGFTVAREPAARGGGVVVRVEHGAVEVDVPDEPAPRRVAAGESVVVGAASSANTALVPSTTTTTATATAQAVEATPEWQTLAKARRYREAYAALGPSGFGAATAAASPAQLLQLAELARASGHLADAERAFDWLRKRHRGDSRAGLAAFELGRLRMDNLGNPAGAAEALADALALGLPGALREDAEARRVQALDASGARAACAKAREAYLAKYPSGAHAAGVRARCPSP